MSTARPEMTPELRIRILNVLENGNSSISTKITVLFEELKKAGFTQQYIADDSGVSKQMISRMKSEDIFERGIPKLENLIYISRTLQFDKSLRDSLIGLYYPEIVEANRIIEQTSFK